MTEDIKQIEKISSLEVGDNIELVFEKMDEIIKIVNSLSKDNETHKKNFKAIEQIVFGGCVNGR